MHAIAGETENLASTGQIVGSLEGLTGDEGKRKVTYYLSETIQSQLKVKAACEGYSMSEIVEQALRFYLEHADIVQRDGMGHTHQLYHCPACQSALVFRNRSLQAVSNPGIQPLI
ncbi:MAG: hypothetical protein HC918_07660 [Oscillatoriales cyanobacterium SM2_1_8]|nr:hypothetical protein [Oscillatoriales cyanobacterium SM2_1_8]